MNSSDKLIIFNPYNSEKVGTINLKSQKQIDQILISALNFNYKISSIDRSEILKKCADYYKKNINSEALLITKESGLSIKQATYEVNRAINVLNYSSEYAKKLDSTDISSLYLSDNSKSDVELSVIKEPLDLAVAITPFNHPLNQVVHKIAPAIAAGTAIVLKPSEKTPLSAYRLREIFTFCGLPNEAFIVLNGFEIPETVKQLVSFKSLDVVSFTGSVEIGQRIEKMMLDNNNYLKKYIPELGGNAAFVVDHDADIELSSSIALSAFDNCGQRCTSIKRILLHNSIADEFIFNFKKKAMKLTYGNPFDKKNELGTLIDENSAKNIFNRVNNALNNGAKLVYGNQVDGALYSPTIIDHVKPDMDLVKYETFGPIAPIIRINSIDECINIVNSTSFKLAGAIATSSKSTAERYSKSISVGQFSWNGSPGYRTENAPFGGFGISGNGEKEGVIHSIDGLMRIRTFWKHKQ